MRQEFPSEWSRFINPGAEREQILTFTIGRNRLPFFVQNRKVVVSKIELFAKGDTRVDYDLIMSYEDSKGDTTDSSEIIIASGSGYGDVQQLTLRTTDAVLDLEELDITKPVSLKIKRSAASDYKRLPTDSDVLEDLYAVLHYRLAKNT